MPGFALPEEVELLRNVASRFAQEKLGPKCRQFETDRRLPAEITHAYRELGLAGVDIPTSFGGSGLGALARTAVAEEIAAVDAGGALALDPGWSCAQVFSESRLYDDLKARVASLTSTVDGRVLLVCPEECENSGANVTARASWVPADTLSAVVLATRSGVFFVDKGISLKSVRGGGLRASGASELRLERVPFAIKFKSRALSQRLVARSRITLAAYVVGVLRAATEYATRYAKDREAFGRPIAHHQAIAFLLAEMRIAVDGARLAVLDAAWRVDSGHPFVVSAASTILAASQATDFVTPNAIQILGGHGFMKDHPVEKYMRDARALLQLAGGIQAAENIVSQSVERAEIPLRFNVVAHRIEDSFDLAVDVQTEQTLSELKTFGEAQIRPRGLDADRAEAPLPPDHPYFDILLARGQGRTRWRPSLVAESGVSAAPRSAVAAVLSAEEFSYWDRGVAVATPGPGLGEPPILQLGTPLQKERFLDRFVEPDRPRWGAFAMTEPGAGSDVAAIRTSARKDGHDWILNGEKSFSANASRADWIVVFATIDRTLGRAGHRAFVVERGTPGLGNFKVERKMGLKAYESTSFTLTDCRVADENLLGAGVQDPKRAGFKGAMETFNASRPIVAAMAVGIGRAALDESMRFARTNGILKREAICLRLERVYRDLQIARLLCLKAAWLADTKQPNILEASAAKAYAPQVAWRATSLGMDVLGVVGARGDHLIEKLFRDVKAMDLVEGTGQIQRLIMARHLVQLPRD